MRLNDKNNTIETDKIKENQEILVNGLIKHGNVSFEFHVYDVERATVVVACTCACA